VSCRLSLAVPGNVTRRKTAISRLFFIGEILQKGFEMNEIQELQFSIMEKSSFNGFDGEAVVKKLKKHQDLWRGVVFIRLGSLICLRDIEDDQWNNDTLYITPVKGKEDELFKLCKKLGADEVDWIGTGAACELLGSYSQESRSNPKQIVRVWFD
jgi:hypothetical protein